MRKVGNCKVCDKPILTECQCGGDRKPYGVVLQEPDTVDGGTLVNYPCDESGKVLYPTDHQSLPIGSGKPIPPGTIVRFYRYSPEEVQS